jgi:hypothetical protein
MTFLQWIRSENEKQPRGRPKKEVEEYPQNQFKRFSMKSRMQGVLLIARGLSTNPKYKEECDFLLKQINEISE